MYNGVDLNTIAFQHSSISQLDPPSWVGIKYVSGMRASQTIGNNHFKLEVGRYYSFMIVVLSYMITWCGTYIKLVVVWFREAMEEQ